MVVASARVALAATRLLARAPVVKPLLARSAATGRQAREHGRERIETAAQSAFSTPEVGRIVDGALASRLPEKVARSSIDHNVGDRVAAEIEPERERLVKQLLESPEFDQALEHALSSPKVREALTKQTTSLAEDVLGELRKRVLAADRKVERGSAAGAIPFAGFSSRAVAFAADLVVAHVVFLVLSALIGLIAALVDLRPQWLYAALAGSGWLLVVGGYFVFFWTLGGQTPGMRLMHLRVVARPGTAPGVGRSVVRFLALLVAMIPLFLGFVPILFDRKRRGLQDFVAGTVVEYADEPGRA